MSRIQWWGRITIASTLGIMFLALPQANAQMGGLDENERPTTGTRTSRNNYDPMNPPSLARLAATTLDGDIDDLLGMVGDLGGVGCAFEVDDPAMNVDCGDPDFVPCSDTTRTGVGPDSDFYFVNGYDLVKGVILYNALEKELYLGLRVVGVIGDVDGDRNPDTICPEASSFIEEAGIGPQDSYRWEFDTACGSQFNPGPFLEIKGPTTAGQPLFDIFGLTYDTVEMKWAGNGGLDSSEIEVKLTGVDLLTNFPNGGFQARVFVGTQRDCLGENSSGFGLCEPPIPALIATKSCVDVCAGDSTTCTIKVWNTGLVPIDVTVFDDVPTGHTYVAGSASGIGEPAAAGGNDILFTGPTLSVGDSVTFSFQIDTPEACFGQITNNATATGTFTSACYKDDPNFRATDYDFDDTYQCLLNTTVLDIQDQAKCPGDNVTFTAVATGENLTYQWYKGGTQGNPGSGTLIQGATGASYSINGVQESDQSTYCVLVTGDCDTDWDCALLTVNPPTVAEAFGDQTKCPGENVTFTVSATGLNLTYQWYKGGTQGNSGSGTVIQGATSASYTITGIVEGDEATYCVLVTGTCETDWECAALTVDPPTVAEAFGDQTKCPGENVTFTVSATGLNLSYQWYKGGTQGSPESGTVIQGATSASYTINGIVEGDEASYCVLVTGTCGTDWECASLTVDPPTVAQTIGDQTKCPGENVTFTVSATGLNLSYQWYKGGTQGSPESGTLIQGATSASYSINGIVEGDEASYCVLVTGTCGTDWECASLTVDPPTVAQPFGDQIKCPGENVTFTVSATGLNLSYQWYKGGTQGSPESGTLLPGKTSASLTLTGITIEDQATYCVLVTGQCGTQWECASLTVDPSTTSGPIADQTKCPGESVTFSANNPQGKLLSGESAGVDVLTFQWYKGGTQGSPQSGTLLQGETGPSLTINPVKEADEGTYCVYIVGRCGTDWECASLTVDPPTVAQTFGDQTKCPGENVTFTVSATGLNLSYQWYKGGTQGSPESGTLIQGATSASYTITGIVEGDEASYCVLVTGTCGTDWECASLTVDPPTVAQTFGDQIKCPGEDATFTVSATGLNLTYQWYKGGTQGSPESGTLIPGETSASLTLTGITIEDQATYCVLVTGQCGTQWECASLTVDPSTTSGPIADQTRCPGESVSFCANNPQGKLLSGESAGVDVLTFQWYKGGTQGSPQSGTLLQGETGSCLTIDPVKEADEGTYCVYIVGRCGNDWECATLTVDPPTEAGDIADQTTCVDEDVTFTVNATGINLFYQWYKGGTQGNPQSGTALETENGTTLTLTGVMESDEAVYCVYVSGDCGSVWKCATLTVDEVLVTVDSKVACRGEDVKLCPNVSGGTGPYTFSWTGPEFASEDSCVTVSMAGDYTVTVTDVNQCQGEGSGKVSYLEAALEAYAINQSACVGETGAMSIVIKNTSAGSQGFTLDCTIDGQVQDQILVNPIASGDSATVPIEVICVEGKTVAVNCTVTADLVDSPDCMAQVQVNGQVTCFAPRVEITKNDGLREECAISDTEVTYTIEVRNTGPVALTDIVVLDEVLGPVAAYVGNSASGNPVSQPASGGTGILRWEDEGPLAPGAKLTFTYRLNLGGSGACSDQTAYENTASVEAYCGEAKTDDETTETTCITCPSCWMTGGGFLNEGQKNGHKEDNFGGNVGPPPSGSWQHVQRVDNKITFNFHSHDVVSITCYHDGGDGPCSPATDNNVILFGGTGMYSMGNGPRNKEAEWSARVEDHGEPGNNPKRGGCGSADFYTIEVRDPVTKAVVFTAEGFLDGGNFQIHKDTGKKLNGASSAVIGMNVTLNAFPNPISSSGGSIRFNVPTRYADERVEVNLFDVSGRLVRKLVDEPRPAGIQSAHWNLRNDSGQRITAGIYFTRLRIASEEKIVRLMVLSQQ